MYGKKPCEHNRERTLVRIFVKLGRHVNNGEKINRIESGGRGQRSRSLYEVIL